MALTGRLALPILAAALLAAPAVRGTCASTATGSVHGRVEFRSEPGVAPRRPAIGDLGTAPARDLPDRRQAVVFLEVAPRGAFEEREGAHATMDQRNENFIPHVLAVTTGTVVDFRNDDRTYHNVFSLSKPRSFDLGRYAAGQSKSVRFDRPGLVRVFCEIHSHMSAFILVFAHRFFAVTGTDGEYRIGGIPPGTYVLSVWHPSLSAAPQPITIPEQGGDVEMDFSLS